MPATREIPADQPVQALLVVDPQAGVLQIEPVPDADRVVATLGALIVRARSAGVPVVYLQNRGGSGSVDEPGTPGWPIDARLQPEAAEPVLEKAADDGFDGTGLAELLDERGIRHVAVSGLLSEMCVAATARSALARGLGVTVVTDAHATYDLDDIPARVVARVAEHALGDEVRLCPADQVVFAGER